MTQNQRPRRNRASHLIRDLVAETIVDRRKLIMPHFVLEGKSLREPIASMPGISRVSVENLLKDIEADHKTGIDKILLFGIPEKKDEEGSGAYDRNGIAQGGRALRKSDRPTTWPVMTTPPTARSEKASMSPTRAPSPGWILRTVSRTDVRCPVLRAPPGGSSGGMLLDRAVESEASFSFLFGGGFCHGAPSSIAPRGRL